MIVHICALWGNRMNNNYSYSWLCYLDRELKAGGGSRLKCN